jgi:RimJ/RimL family protein N-acetyltransferase
MKILETNRLGLRELDSATDAEFMFELLNSPKFIQYIGDRGVRSVEQARTFIETRYQPSYELHGYGLYTVERREDGKQVGICGFVRRDSLPGPDIGFAFLPEYERNGYGYESAAAIMEYGRSVLGLDIVLAITTTDNEASGRLLEKLGFAFAELIESGEETLKLYRFPPDTA